MAMIKKTLTKNDLLKNSLNKEFEEIKMHLCIREIMIIKKDFNRREAVKIWMWGEYLANDETLHVQLPCSL